MDAPPADEASGREGAPLVDDARPREDDEHAKDAASLPSRDFQMYSAAMQAWSMSQTENLLRRIGARKHVDTMIDGRDGRARRRPEDAAGSAGPGEGESSRACASWLQYAWRAMRPAILQGLIVYGRAPRRERRPFVRVDQRLPTQKIVLNTVDAQLKLATRYPGRVRSGDPPRFHEVVRPADER